MDPHVRLLSLAFILIVLSPSHVGAYSTAWCGSCHQLLVENDGLFAYNGSAFQDLTWELKAKGLRMEELLDFINTLGVTNAGNLTIIYAYPYDNLYLGIYNGSSPIVLKPVIPWYADNAGDFLFYNGSIFLVASSGSSPHSASDSVFRLNPKTLKVTGNWDLAWATRNQIAPDNAGNIPYAWVKLGLDNKGRLWARVDMILPNTTVYYLYRNGEFELKNETPVGFHVPEVRAPFKIEVEEGIGYHLPYFLPGYVSTKYFLLRNGTREDITREVQELAYSSRPLRALYGFWSWDQNEWVVSFRMYNLPVVYRIQNNCRKAVEVDGLPLAKYNGSYVILGNGTLSWRNYTVKTPRKTYYWPDHPEEAGGSPTVSVYRKDNRPLVAFLWEVHRNGSFTMGFTAYEPTDSGFRIFNTTDKSELGQNLVPSQYIPVKGRYVPNNETGALVLNESTRTAFILSDGERLPVNYTIANNARAVIVGNDTFLIPTWANAYVVPPYDKPVSVLDLPLCSDVNTGTTEGIGEAIVLITAAAIILMVIVVWKWKK